MSDRILAFKARARNRALEIIADNCVFLIALLDTQEQQHQFAQDALDLLQEADAPYGEPIDWKDVQQDVYVAFRQAMGPTPSFAMEQLVKSFITELDVVRINEMAEVIGPTRFVKACRAFNPVQKMVGTAALHRRDYNNLEQALQAIQVIVGDQQFDAYLLETITWERYPSRFTELRHKYEDQDPDLTDYERQVMDIIYRIARQRGVAAGLSSPPAKPKLPPKAPSPTNVPKITLKM